MLLIGIIFWRIPKYMKNILYENHDFKLNKEYGIKSKIF